MWPVVERGACTPKVFRTRKHPRSQKYKRSQMEGFLRRRKSSSERMTFPERMAASKVGCRREGQRLEGME